MTRLVLFRHGIAMPHGTPDIEDSQRPLTAKGERRTRQVAKGLRPMLKKIDRILTSPLPRALRTAEIVADVLQIPELIERCDGLLPQADPKAMRELVEARKEDRLMIVGHNPNLSELLTLLLTKKAQSGALELRKGGSASLRRDSDGKYQLEWLIRPRIARFMD